MGDTLGSQTISTRLQRIAQKAHQAPTLVFDNLYYLIDLPLLREAYRRTRKDAAPGSTKSPPSSMRRIWRSTSVICINDCVIKTTSPRQ
jgi:hypothetical protein